MHQVENCYGVAQSRANRKMHCEYYSRKKCRNEFLQALLACLFVRSRSKVRVGKKQILGSQTIAQTECSFKKEIANISQRVLTSLYRSSLQNIFLSLRDSFVWKHWLLGTNSKQLIQNRFALLAKRRFSRQLPIVALHSDPAIVLITWTLWSKLEKLNYKKDTSNLEDNFLNI